MTRRWLSLSTKEPRDLVLRLRRKKRLSRVPSDERPVRQPPKKRVDATKRQTVAAHVKPKA